ncbi:Beta-galactosidase [Capsicum annuum]|uniref:Beta-galactosidase n=1 Tax=Capsicum annuum TaxID=4072 RepID=A0A2G2Z995_CAPAN|nr:Beta-galactosidase [Capsicum annuum]
MFHLSSSSKKWWNRSSVKGLLNEPKYRHLRDLHKVIKQSELTLVSSYATLTSLGSNQEANVYRSKSGACVAFLSNYDAKYSVRVSFQNKPYDFPPWSINILPDCKTAVYNTARVRKPISIKMMLACGGMSWQSCNEETPTVNDSDTLTTNGLWKQKNVTRDSLDYLWYMTDVNITSNEGFLKNGKDPYLTVMSAGHVLHVFSVHLLISMYRRILVGTVHGALDNSKLTYSGNVKLRADINKISNLIVSVGLPVNFLLPVSPMLAVGTEPLFGLNEGSRDLAKQKWSDKVGLKGESLSLHTLSGSFSVEWVQGSLVAQKQPLTWYKAIFNSPGGNEPLPLDMVSMGKRQIWINGEGVGRHWPGYTAQGDCSKCNYAGTFNEKKC